MSPPLQLFILGPAFALPSIDAECNAAVALLQRHARGRYTLIPTHRHASRLPSLFDPASSTAVHGFANIARHLRDTRVSDEHARWRDRGPSVAIASLIDARAPRLLDVALYVAFENYRRATRPAFTRILPWHANYILPPARRAAARQRTEYLGISSLDVDDVHEDLSDKPAGMEGGGGKEFGAATHARASLLLPRKDTLRSLLAQPQHAAAFKLHALADELFAPLEEMLAAEGGRDWLLGGEEATAADYLLFGYLVLMLYPDLPQAWLQATLRRKYPRLVKHTERLYEELEVGVQTEKVLSLIHSTSEEEADIDARRRELGVTLPFVPAARVLWTEQAADIFLAVKDQLPILSTTGQLQLRDAPARRPQWQTLLPTALLSTPTAAAVLAFLAARRGVLLWPRSEGVHVFAAERAGGFVLGSALAGVALMGRRGR